MPLAGNGMTTPNAAAFDGQRVLITSDTNDTVSLWKAADLTPLGFFSTGAGTGSLQRLQRRSEFLDHPAPDEPARPVLEKLRVEG